MTIPVVDFTASDAQSQFVTSLREIGFGVLKNHPLDNQLISQLYDIWYDFFNGDVKYEYGFDEETHAGFICQRRSETAKGNDIKDIKEFYHYYPGKQCPESLVPVTHDLFTMMSQLAKELLFWVQNGLPMDIERGLSMPLSDMIEDSTHTLLRIIHYPPISSEVPVGAVRAAAHEDINLLTLLPAATAKGLQVKTKSGEWLDVPCDPGWLIVNTGDMLSECTQHYFKATSHRVINPSQELAHESRVSSPLFLHPREDVVLSDRHTAGSYRIERFKELGLKT